jgi:cold shock CspA family protein
VVVLGRVSEFDEQRGIGAILPKSSPHSEPIMFHCIEIANGTRHISEGATVTYRVRLKLGRPEAFAVTVA